MAAEPGQELPGATVSSKSQVSGRNASGTSLGNRKPFIRKRSHEQWDLFFEM